MAESDWTFPESYWNGTCTICDLPRRECEARLDQDEGIH